MITLESIKAFWKALTTLTNPRMAAALAKPGTFEDAVNAFCRLINNMDKGTREYLVKQPSAEEFAAAIHHSLGRTIRNDWDLWDHQSNINRHFYQRWHINHGDDISGMITMCAWQQLNGHPKTPMEFAAGYLQHWKEMRKEPLKVEVDKDGNIIGIKEIK